MSFDHKSRMTRHAVKHSCSLKVMIFNRGSRQARTQGAMQGMHPPQQTERGVDMTLDFFENHRQKYFVLHIT